MQTIGMKLLDFNFITVAIGITNSEIIFLR